LLIDSAGDLVGGSRALFHVLALIWRACSHVLAFWQFVSCRRGVVARRGLHSRTRGWPQITEWPQGSLGPFYPTVCVRRLLSCFQSPETKGVVHAAPAAGEGRRLNPDLALGGPRRRPIRNSASDGDPTRSATHPSRFCWRAVMDTRPRGHEKRLATNAPRRFIRSRQPRCCSTFLP
jgi:hypothetical protein